MKAKSKSDLPSEPLRKGQWSCTCGHVTFGRSGSHALLAFPSAVLNTRLLRQVKLETVENLLSGVSHLAVFQLD